MDKTDVLKNYLIEQSILPFQGDIRDDISKIKELRSNYHDSDFYIQRIYRINNNISLDDLEDIVKDLLPLETDSQVVFDICGTWPDTGDTWTSGHIDVEIQIQEDPTPPTVKFKHNGVELNRLSIKCIYGTIYVNLGYSEPN